MPWFALQGPHQYLCFSDCMDPFASGSWLLEFGDASKVIVTLLEVFAHSCEQVARTSIACNRNSAGDPHEHKDTAADNLLFQCFYPLYVWLELLPGPARRLLERCPCEARWPLWRCIRCARELHTLQPPLHWKENSSRVTQTF